MNNINKLLPEDETLIYIRDNFTTFQNIFSKYSKQRINEGLYSDNINNKMKNIISPNHSVFDDIDMLSIPEEEKNILTSMGMILANDQSNFGQAEISSASGILNQLQTTQITTKWNPVAKSMYNYDPSKPRSAWDVARSNVSRIPSQTSTAPSQTSTEGFFDSIIRSLTSIFGSLGTIFQSIWTPLSRALDNIAGTIRGAADDIEKQGVTDYFQNTMLNNVSLYQASIWGIGIAIIFLIIFKICKWIYNKLFGKNRTRENVEITSFDLHQLNESLNDINWKITKEKSLLKEGFIRKTLQKWAGNNIEDACQLLLSQRKIASQYRQQQRENYLANFHNDTFLTEDDGVDVGGALLNVGKMLPGIFISGFIYNTLSSFITPIVGSVFSGVLATFVSGGLLTVVRKEYISPNMPQILGGSRPNPSLPK